MRNLVGLILALGITASPAVAQKVVLDCAHEFAFASIETFRWGGVGMGTSTTTASTYTEGTLIIDGCDPDDDTLVWRGSGTVTVKAKPEAQMKQVTKVLKKLGSRWDRVVAGKGK